MNLKKMCSNYFTAQDLELFNSVTGYEVKHLLNKIDSHLEEKILSSEKHVKINLDRFGAHVLRIMLARKIHEKKQLAAINLYDSIPNRIFKILDEVNNVGFATIPSFDPSVDYEDYKILKIIMSILNPIENSNVKSINKRISVDEVYDITNNKKISKHSFVNNDPNYSLHCDTFHPSYKIFIYYNDVTKDHGPFSYIEKSNNLNVGRLKLLYDITKNIDNLSEKEYNSIDKSFRVKIKDDHCRLSKDINEVMKNYNLSQEKIITGNKKTTIITDVSGFHRRYPAKIGKIRKNKRYTFHRTHVFELS